MRWLRITVLTVLVLGVVAYGWRSFMGRDRGYYGQQAQAAMDAENWPLAARNLQSLLEVDPGNDESRWFLSLMYQLMIQKEGQPLEDVSETPQSLALLQELDQREPSLRVNVRLLRHYVRTGQRDAAIALLPEVYKDPDGNRDATTLASRLLAKPTSVQESDRILEILEPNFSPVSLIYIRLKMSVYTRDERKSSLDNYLVKALGQLAAANPAALLPLSPVNLRLLSETLQAALLNAPETREADRRFLQTLQILNRYRLTERGNEFRIELAELAVGLSESIRNRFPLPPMGFGGERTRQRLLHDRRHRSEASRRLLEFGMPLVDSGEATPIIYESVARAAMEIEDDSRQIAIFREGLRLYGDLPSDLRNEILAVHRDTVLEMIAAGKLDEAAASPLDQVGGTQPLGHLIAGYVAVEHGRLDSAQRHVTQVKQDKSLTIPVSLLQTRIHLAAARWQSGLDVLVPLEARWDELSSSERVWITKSLGGRDELRLMVAYCHVQLNQHDEAAPIIAKLAEGAYRANAHLLQLISLVRQEKWIEARSLAAQAYHTDPKNVALLLAEFVMRVREGRPDLASTLLYQSTSLYPTDLRLQISLARWLAVHNQFAQSLSLLKQTAKQFPDDQVGPLMAAEMLLKLNRESELDSLLKSLNRPTTASAIVLLSACSQLRKTGLDEAADALFEAAPGLPSAQEFSLSTAVLSASRGHYRQAIDLLATTLGIPKPLRRGPDGYLQQLEAEIHNAAPKQMASKIDGLLKTFPGEPALLLASTSLASKRGDVETALARLKELKSLDPVPGRVEYMRARILNGAERIDESRAALNEVLAAVPQNGEAQALAAELAWKQHDYETALKHLDLAGAESHATAERVFIRADSLLKLDRALEAEPVLLEFLKRDPQRPDAWLTLAATQYSSERPAQAILSLESGLKELPKHEAMQERYLELLGETRQLAKLEAALKRFSGARLDLKRCLYLAEVYLESGDVPSADKWLGKARTIAPYSSSDRLLFMEGVLLQDKGIRTGLHSWFVQAREKYTQLLRCHPEHARGFNNLAWLLMRRFHAVEEAGEFATALLSHAKTDDLSAEVLDTVVESLRQTSQTEQAFELVESSLERFPAAGALRFQYAALLFETSGGDEEKQNEAREQLMKARDQGLPTHHQAEFLELSRESP